MNFDSENRLFLTKILYYFWISTLKWHFSQFSEMKMPISQNVKLKTIFPEAKILEKMSQKYGIIINYFWCLSLNVIPINYF